jgi:hypothetical protein
MSGDSGTVADAGADSGAVTGSDAGTVPTLVQHVSSSSTHQNAMSSPYCYLFQLPNPTTAGDAVVVGVTYQGGAQGPTPTITDDSNNTYNVVEHYFDNADGQTLDIALALEVAAGARAINLCFSADPGFNVQPMASEFAHVSGADGTGTANNGSGTMASAGTLTPGSSGDLVYQVAVSLSFDQSSFAASSQATFTPTLLSADIKDGWAAQAGLYSSTTPLTPTLSMGTSHKWISAAILLAPGSSGGVPNGLRIVHLDHSSVPGPALVGTNFDNPLTIQAPCSGNLLVAMVGGGNHSCQITGITDSNQNSWVQAGSTYDSGNDVTMAFYVANPVCSSDLTLTINWDVSDGDFTIFMYDVAGASASPYDSTVGNTGDQTTPGTWMLPFTYTPAASDEIVLVETVWDWNTGTGLVGDFFDTNMFSGENPDGPEPVDQNNAWGHAMATNTNPLSFTWTTFASNPCTTGIDPKAVGAWSGLAVGFKAGAGGVTPPPDGGATQPDAGTRSIAFVQVSAATPQTAQQSVSTTFPQAQRAGDLNVVVLGWNDSTTPLPAASAVTDSSRNVYQLAVGPIRSANLSQGIYFASNIAASGSNMVTVTFQNPAANVDLRTVEYAGVSAVDQTTQASGTSQMASTTNVMAAGAPELVFVAGTTVGLFSAGGPGYTTRIITTPDGDIIEDRVANQSGSYAASAVQNASAEWVLQAVTFK